MSLNLHTNDVFYDGTEGAGAYSVYPVQMGDEVTFDWGDGSSPDVVTDADFTNEDAMLICTSPAHQYATVGGFTLTVTVTGPDAGFSPLTTTVVVDPYPFFGFEPTVSGSPWEPGIEFTFTPALPDPADGRTYAWDFGNGDTATPSDGIATETFGFDPDGLEQFFTITFDIHPDPSDVPPCDDPTEATSGIDLVDVDSSFGYDNTDTPEIVFSATNQIGDNATDWTYEWDFGDGSPHDTTSGATATHTYEPAGAYTASLTVTRVSDTHTGTTSQGIDATVPIYPDSGFRWLPATPVAPVEVTFTANAPGTLEFAWNFGDGSPEDDSSGKVAKHTYSASGSYDVELWVTDPDFNIFGVQTNTTITVVVAAAPMSIGVRFDPNLVLVDVPVDVLITVAGGDGAPTGSIDVTIDGVDLGAQTLVDGVATISHTFTTAGDHTVAATYAGDDDHDAIDLPLAYVPVHGPGVMPLDAFDPAWGGARPVTQDGGDALTAKLAKNDVGSMAFSAARLQAAIGALGYNTRVRVGYKGSPAMLSRHLEGIVDTMIGSGDQAAKVIKVTVRGILAELEESVVESEGGAGWKPYYPARTFDWRSGYLDRSTWTPSVFPPFDGDDSGVVGVYGRQWPPVGWPAPFAGWVWSEAEDPTHHNMPIGDTYGAKAFNVPGDDDIITDLWMTCDDYFEAALDGAPWLQGDTPPNGSWENPYRRVGTVSPGNHLLTWHCQNFDLGWPDNAQNIAALAFCMFKLDSTKSGAITYQNMMFESGPNPNPLLSIDPTAPPLPDGAVWLGYPDTVPGFTPGHVMKVLFGEAWERNELLPWVLTFDEVNDSAGNPWSGTSPYTWNVGTTYLDVVKTLVTDDVDVVVGPDMPPTLHMFNKGGVPAEAGSIPNFLGAGAVTMRGRARAEMDDAQPNLTSWQFTGQG